MNKKQKLDQRGIAHLAIIIIILVVAVILFAGKQVYDNQRNSKDGNNQAATVIDTRTSKSANSGGITWSFDNNVWKPSSKPPACPDPLLQSPVDLSKATAILYPGQTRGIYKAHGGFIFRDNTDNNIEVKVAIDSKLVKVARYIQTGQVQYLLDFESPCGVATRYDHLHTLTTEFMDIMKKLPEPKVDDSRTTDINSGKSYKAGTLIATRIGFLAPIQNTTLDFGVYDYRQPNEASKDPTYAAAHATGKYQDYYAICWLNDLPAKDKALALALPGGDGKAGKTSDYCK